MRQKLEKFVYPAFLFFLSLFLFWPLLKLTYPALQPSVEPTVWAQAEFIKNNFPNLSWNSFWYLGYPFRFSGPPIFVYLLAFLSKISGVSIPEAEKWLILILLSTIFVSLYIFISFILKNRFWAFLASVFFIVVPSFGYIFPQAYTVGLNAGLAPWHFVGFLTYGGGQRILGLAILPVSLLFFWKALDKWKHIWVVLAVFFASLLFLSDHVTSISFLIGIFIILFSLGWDKLGRSLVLLVLAFLLASFWYTPSYIQNILFSPSLAGKPLKDVVFGLVRFFIVLLPSLLAVLALRKRRIEVSFCILWFFLFSFLAILYFLINPDFLTEHSRFFPEIDMGIVMGLGLIGARVKGLGVKGFLLVVIVVGLGFRIFFGFPIVCSPLKVEPEIATQLKNISNGQKAYLSGSTAFWLNFFAPDIPQVRGGVDQAATNPFWADASYQIREGEDGNLSGLWLKALRVPYIVVHAKSSAEFYHDFKFPEKFSKVAKKVFDNGGGDAIYQLETPNLAQIASKTLLGLPKPKDGADLEKISNYVEVLEAGRKVYASWISPSQLEIKMTNLSSNEGISLGVTYDSGWEAKLVADQKSLALSKDPIGNIFIYPVAGGRDLEIVLKHGPRIDNWFGYIFSLFGLFVLAFFPKLEPRLKKLTPESLRKEFEDEE